MQDNLQNNLSEEETLDLSTLLNILLGKWYWFVASILLFVALGCAYIYRTPKVYKKQATILIKESKNGGGMASQAAAFADLASMAGMSTSSTENEMLILQSRSLMEEVVYRLGAHVTYYQYKNLRSLELYENTPFRIVEKERSTLMPAYLEVIPQSETTFKATVEYFSIAKNAMVDTLFTGRFNEESHYPFGLAIIEAQPQMLPYYVGEEIRVYISSPKRIASAFLKSLTVSQMSKMSSMLSVSVQNSRPRKAEDIINILLDQYNKDAINDKNQVLESTERFIQERLLTIRQELGDVDSRIEGYKRSALSTNIQTESQIYLQNASSLEEKISSTDLQLNLVTILANFLSKPSNMRELLPYNIGLDNAGLNSQIQTYNDNMLRLNRMVAASSERNPVVVDLSQSLESARASIVKTVQDMQHSLQMQQKELLSRNQRATGRIEAVATNERSIQSITRDQQIKAELYLYLLNKSEENAILKSTTEPNARIIDRAFGDDSPVAPRKMVILLACLLIGAILPAAYFLLKDLLYTKVRGRSDVVKVVKAPLLGEIPSKPKHQKDQFMVVQNGNNSQLGEAFRILRTNLGFLNPAQETKVIAFTSTLPGEGKTYVSSNMAMALALSGKRVCLVGADLRRPTLQSAFGMKGRKGVSDYLVGNENHLSNLIVSVEEHENLFLLPAGTVPPNPAELLMSQRFDAMVAELRDRFDFVVIDQPPMGIVADTGIANRVADTTLYVVRAGLLNRRELDGIQELYQDQKLRNMGIVITDVDYERLYYSVGYSGYGKRYGYSASYNHYGQTYYNPQS